MGRAEEAGPGRMGKRASVVGWKMKMRKRMGAWVVVGVGVAVEETRLEPGLELGLEAGNPRGRRVGGRDAGGDSGGREGNTQRWRSER